MDGPAVSGPTVDVLRPHPARIYNYWLGGKDNFAADREVADAMTAALPHLPMMARAHRRFLERAVRHLAAEVGVRQFVHVGCGLPTSYDLHEIAQEPDPSARIVYVDDDPVVAAHARALLVGNPKGEVAFVPCSADDPPAVFDDPELTGVVDLDLPVGVVLSSALLNRPDAEVRDLLADLRHRLPAGSHLVLSHPTDEFSPATEQAAEIGRAAEFDNAVRRRPDVEALLDGWELVDPGVVPILGWRPDGLDAERDERSVHVLGAVVRHPGALGR
jgi:SAM-dependent methyltransferase